MKFKVDIECTPQEARSFLGLPDVEPMQQQLMLLVADRVRKNVERMDPENLMKTWVPNAVKGWQGIVGGMADVAAEAMRPRRTTPTSSGAAAKKKTKVKPRKKKSSTRAD